MRDATDEPMDGAKVYRKTATILARRIDEPFMVRTMEGDHTGKAGDYLVQANTELGERWVIDAAVFAATYVPDAV